MNKQFLHDLVQSIEVRRQTEQRLRATMSVLLTRSENQILVLETLLKRLVQVCVHTQDKRLAKELKLMDFTRLAKRISDDHTQIRQMLLHEEAGSVNAHSPAENYLMEAVGGPGAGGQGTPTPSNPAPHMDDGPQISNGHTNSHQNAVNLSQYRVPTAANSTTPSGHGTPQMMQQQQLLHHHQQQQQQQAQHSQQAHSQQAQQAQQQAMRRDATAGMGQGRDPAMQLRHLWGQDGGPPLESSGMPSMNSMPGLGSMNGHNGGGGGGSSNPLLISGNRGGGGGGGDGRMRMPQMARSASGAGGSQMTNVGGQGGNSQGHIRSYNDGDAFNVFHN